MISGTLVWIWAGDDLYHDGRYLDDFIEKMSLIPGKRGVMLKGYDGGRVWHPGIRTWGAWDRGLNDKFRSAGIDVNLWGFNYGTAGGELEGEMEALQVCLDYDTPDLIVLNIEDQIMRTERAYSDVMELVGAAKGFIPVGVSSVWRWKKSMNWPFDAALRGGVDFWMNQAYSENWNDGPVGFDYVNEAFDYADKFGGGKPELPALWSAPPSTYDSMVTNAERCLERGATGLSWWRGETANEHMWQAIVDAASMISSPDNKDLQLEAAWRRSADCYGAKKWSGKIKLAHYGDGQAPEYDVLRTDNSLLVLLPSGLVINRADYLMKDGEDALLVGGTLERY